jgi:hypothetical protein
MRKERVGRKRKKTGGKKMRRKEKEKGRGE